MSFRPGKIYQEMIEVEDEKKGIGCLGWLLISGVVLIVLFYALGFIMTHPILSILGVVAVVFIIKFFRN